MENLEALIPAACDGSTVAFVEIVRLFQDAVYHAHPDSNVHDPGGAMVCIRISQAIS